MRLKQMPLSRLSCPLRILKSWSHTSDFLVFSLFKQTLDRISHASNLLFFLQKKENLYFIYKCEIFKELKYKCVPILKFKSEVTFSSNHLARKK